MKASPMFKENGGGYDISPAGVLLTMAALIYADSNEMTNEGIRKAKNVIDEILAAAQLGGYRQCDMLRALLARNKPTQRMAEMAQAACDAAGDVAMDAVFKRARLQ